MSKICGIYKITNKLDCKCYIGLSKDIRLRINRHKSLLNNNLHKNNHLQQAWNKHGKDSFNFEIILQCQENDLSMYEKYFIKKFKSNNKQFGYNFSSGGESGFSGCKFTEERKALYRLKFSGKNNPMYGTKMSEEHKAKLLKIFKGNKRSKESCKKQANSIKGINNPFYGKTHSRELILERSKPVLQYNFDNILIKEWSSSAIIEKELGIARSCIRKCCNNILKTSGGFIWKWKI